MKYLRPLAIVLLIVVPALLRAPRIHWNVVPIGAISLFAGARIRNKAVAIAVPLLSMLLGDLLIGMKMHDIATYSFHNLMPVIYGTYLLTVGLGILLEQYERRRDSAERAPNAEAGAAAIRLRQFAPIGIATLSGSVMFFLITNFAEWVAHYEHTWKELARCFYVALPFFSATVVGDMIGALLLFGGYHLLSAQHAVAMQRSQQF